MLSKLVLHEKYKITLDYIIRLRINEVQGL